MKLTISLCKHALDKKVRQKTMSVGRFFDFISKPPDERDQKDGPGITLASFDEDAWRQDPRRPGKKSLGGKGSGWLQDAFITASYGYLGDVDNKDVTPYDRITFGAVRQLLDGLGCSYFLHTTYSHEVEHHHLRFYILFSRPLIGTPRQICAAYKRAHEILNRTFGHFLDTRSSPAFMCYRPAVSWDSRKLYKSHLVADRPLWKPPRVKPVDEAEPVKARPPTKFRPLTLREWKDRHGALRISGPISDLIKHGPDPRPNGRPGDRSSACASVYLSLHHAGVRDEDIAALCFNEKYAISERPREKGWDFLCADVARVVGKARET